MLDGVLIGVPGVLPPIQHRLGAADVIFERCDFVFRGFPSWATPTERVPLSASLRRPAAEPADVSEIRERIIQPLDDGLVFAVVRCLHRGVQVGDRFRWIVVYL